MGTLQFLYSYDAYTKECSKCHRVFIGTKDRTESEAIMAEHFQYRTSARRPSTDGFQSACKDCSQGRRNKLGVSWNWVEEQFLKQEGKCGICSEPISIIRGESNSAHLDHDHKTGEPRGLLCRVCNVGLGHFADSRDRLQKAIKYLDSFSHTVIPFKACGND